MISHSHLNTTVAAALNSHFNSLGRARLRLCLRARADHQRQTEQTRQVVRNKTAPVEFCLRPVSPASTLLIHVLQSRIYRHVDVAVVIIPIVVLLSAHIVDAFLRPRCAGTVTTSQHYWHGTAHCQPENPQTELSHAITRSSPASRSQFAAARPFSFSDHSLLHHWAAGEACCSSRLFFLPLRDCRSN